MILVVDDDVHVAAFIRTVLEARGLRVRVAHTSHEAVSLACRETPALILLEPRVPGMQARLSQLPDVPTVVLEKPLTAKDLVARIRPWVV